MLELMSMVFWRHLTTKFLIRAWQKKLSANWLEVDIKDSQGKIIVKNGAKITKAVSAQLEKIEAEKLWPVRASGCER